MDNYIFPVGKHDTPCLISTNIILIVYKNQVPITFPKYVLSLIPLICWHSRKMEWLIFSCSGRSIILAFYCPTSCFCSACSFHRNSSLEKEFLLLCLWMKVYFVMSEYFLSISYFYIIVFQLYYLCYCKLPISPKSHKCFNFADTFPNVSRCDEVQLHVGLTFMLFFECRNGIFYINVLHKNEKLLYNCSLRLVHY